jgi:5-methylcytosine-specific restriction endonuclease McrA
MNNTELARLRSAVANIEAALEYTKSGPVRSAIADDVKMVVWVRDGGACVNCGSKNKLQFDHIIPIAQGGSDNIQVLCAPCNLRKSENIAIPQPDGPALE